MKLKLAVIIATASAVAGCQPTREQLIMQARQDADVCKAYGYRAGTPELADCVRMAAMNREVQRQQAADAAFAMGAVMMSNSMATHGQPLIPQRNCSTIPNGLGGYNTSCF
jgi:hypothetical protein